MKVLKLNLSNNEDTEIFIIIDKVASFRKLTPNKSKVVLKNGIIYEVIQTPEEILALIEDSKSKLKPMNEGFEITGHGEVMGLLDDFLESGKNG